MVEAWHRCIKKTDFMLNNSNIGKMFLIFSVFELKPHARGHFAELFWLTEKQIFLAPWI